MSMAKAIAEGRFARISKLEKTVGHVLRSLGIKLIPQYGIRGDGGRYVACVDFFLPDMNIAMEVNGTFWHSDIRVYPNGPVHFSQRRNMVKYNRKKNTLTQRGINLVEVWEIDFHKDPFGSVRLALGLPEGYMPEPLDTSKEWKNPVTLTGGVSFLDMFP
jgi:G:T-mismatch repair DNA endonuclease (very short patch repair protein)